MKKKIAMVVMLLVSIFSLISLTDTVHKVEACDMPIPNADLPEPPPC